MPRRSEAGKLRLDQRGQLLDHVVVHAVVARPRGLRGVHVEAGAVAEVPGAVRVARHVGAARAGVGGHDDQAQLGRHALRAGLLHEVLVGAGEPRQPVQHRQAGARLLGLRRQVDREHHVAGRARCELMTDALVPAAEALLGAEDFQTHGHVSGQGGVRKGQRAAGLAGSTTARLGCSRIRSESPCGCSCPRASDRRPG